MTMSRPRRLLGSLVVLATALAAPSWAAPLAGGASPQATPWFLFPGEDGAMLSQRDAAGRETMLICRPNSGRLYLSNSAFTREMTSLSLSAGDARGAYDLVPEGPDGGDGERKFQIADIAVGDAVLTAFRRTGRMTMEAGGERIALDSAGDGRATIEQFLTYCGG